MAKPSSPEPPAPATVTVDVPAAGSTHKVLLLPSTFTEFQNAVSGLEAIPDWTDAARRNLIDAAREPAGLQLEVLPDLTPQEAAIVRDHMSVAMLIVAAAAQYEDNDWHRHRANFDRTLGDGLRFLHERTGADYALLIDGTQVRQSGGRLAMKWLGTGRLLGRMQQDLGFDLRREAQLNTLTEDVVRSSEIAGEKLDSDQVRSSIARRLGMDVGGLVPADRDLEGAEGSL